MEGGERAGTDNHRSGDDYILRHLEAVQASCQQMQLRLGPAFEEGLRRARETVDAYDLGPLPEDVGRIESNARELARAASRAAADLQGISDPEGRLKKVGAGLARVSERISALIDSDVLPADLTSREPKIAVINGAGAVEIAAVRVEGRGTVIPAPSEGQIVWSSLARAALYLAIAIGVAYSLNQVDLANAWLDQLEAVFDAILWAHYFYAIGKKK